ncbi:putative glycosyl hydrolase family 115 [Lyophyllum shimeji]|uniref:Glycosyl hydrolase family 115 n=1 Tax=Lyophyllum shimeji TaxID=47721 RepID=A0A9P3Q0A8_LYOSH|nr:putative glycosyl hydrolase family 115 [Lyophyllum shimeji]
MLRASILVGALLASTGVHAIGEDSCVAFTSGASTLPVVSKGKASPILLSADDWPGVQLAASNFAADIQRVTGFKPTVSNFTTTSNASTPTSAAAKPSFSTPIIVGTLGKSSLISQIVNATQLDVSSIQDKWEAFLAREVKNPLPGVDSAYVIIGADKRGTIFALYDHSEQFGVSPWYWWADVPTTKHAELFVAASGCSHGSPTVKYRGIFLNDEQPALQNWAMEKFTNGTTISPLGSPFNHMFYTKLFELMLRMKANYLWPAMWGSAFAVDDPQNQFLADMYGVVMGTSHQEPMMRSTPNEFTLYGKGKWDYVGNTQNIKDFWMAGAERAKPFESVYTLGMRGFGDLPLSEDTNIQLLQQVVADQAEILKTVYATDNIESIPQIWTLYKEVEGYYDAGMKVPDYVTLLWSDDNWGNIRRFPLASERNRTGGAGVYYHVDYVGDPRDYKWITSSQISKIYEQMSIAVDRDATRLWILNVGDLKPYERETEFFITLGWNATRFAPDNLESYVSSWAQREFDVSPTVAGTIVDIVGNLTRFNARRKPELLNATTYSLINYREAEGILAAWATLKDASTKIYNSLSADMKPAFFQLVHHPVLASANMANILIAAGMNNMRASQARLSANALADQAEKFFEQDFDIETEYHQLLDGKWNHMMDQTHLGYYYWQQPMTNTMPAVNRVQSRKQALAGVMRIVPEGTLGAWPGDNPNQCAQGYGCPPPSISLDPFAPFGNRYIDVGAGGPVPFTFTATADQPWLALSPAQGSISPSAPEQRVFASVKDWSQLQDGVNTATITFTATAKGQPNLKVTVGFTANKNTLPGGFKGFVEGGGAVSIEAAHATRNTPVNGVAWKEIQGYGRTLSGVTTFPRLGNNDAAFSPGAGPSLEYDFYAFNTVGNSGNLTLTTYASPSWNAGEANRPLAFAVQLDGGAPQTQQFIPQPPPGGVSAAWGGPDGFVANSIVSVVTKFTGVKPGAHTLKITAIEPAVVIQKLVIDTGGVRPSYLGPPESVIIH